MQFPSAAYDCEMLKLMSRAFDETCRDVARTNASCDGTQTMIALRIMTAASAGERNVERLWAWDPERRLVSQAIGADPTIHQQNG